MDISSQSSEQLIVQARAGDTRAYAELLKRLGPQLAASSDWVQTDFAQDPLLNRSWQEFSSFRGTTAAELGEWLQQVIESGPAAPTAANLETIAPGTPRDQPTVVSQPVAATANSTAADPALTIRDASLGTVVEPPSQGTVDAGGARDAGDTGDGDAATDAAADVGSQDRPAAPTTPATDPLETMAPTAAPVEQTDPLATMAPGGDATLGNHPLATMAGGTAAPSKSRPPVKTFDDYEILDTIAQGGMGVVYKARHRKLNRIVALKMILSGQFANPADIERFHAEAEAAARLSHPNIVGIHDVGECDGQHYFTMQFVEGKSLADLVRDHPLHPRSASKYMADIAEAMQYAHDHGILHRDLKPANILVDGEGVPLITDFGLAKLNPNDPLGDEQARAGHSQMTMDGTVMGTASYMPPEQALGKLDEISVRSDVYSLGATLYDLLTGKPPFGAANVHETIRQVIESEPVAPRVLNTNVPKDLETICLKCLQKSPARRYASAQDLADELRRYRAGEPILARPVGFAERTVRWCYRNPWPTTAIFASLCGLIVATVLWQSAVSARNEAVVARDLAKASRSQLFVAINELFTTWGNVKLLNEPALADVRQELLTAATKLYTDIGKELGDDVELQQELGVSYFRLAQMMFHMEGYAEANKAIESACRIQQQGAPGDVANLKRLGESLTLNGSIKVRLSHGKADPDERLVMLDEAERLYQQAFDVRQGLLELAPDDIEYQRQLWSVQMNLANVSQSIGDAYFQLFDLKQGDATTSPDFKKMEAQYAKAKQQFENVQKQREKLLAADPNVLSVRHDLALGSYNLANICRLLAKYADAEKHANDAIGEFVALLEIDPNDLQNQFDLARCEQQAGEIAAEWVWSAESAAHGRELYEKAVQHYNNAVAVFDALNRNSPSIVTRYKIALGELHSRIGSLHLDMMNHQAARASLEMAVAILKPLGEAHPNSRQVMQALGEVQQGLQFLTEAEAVQPENAATTPAAESNPPQ